MKPQGLKLLRAMVTSVGETYEVRFPSVPDQPIVVRVGELDFVSEQYAPQRVENGVSLFYPRSSAVAGDLLVRLLEYAYAKYLKVTTDRFADADDDDILSVYTKPAFHYRADISLHDLTGWPVSTTCSGQTVEDGSQAFADVFRGNKKLSQRVNAKLEQLSSQPDRVVATTCTIGSSHSKTFLEPGNKLHPWHDHVIHSVNHAEQTIQLLDPTNSNIGLVLQYSDFFRYFYLIADAEIPAQ